MSISGSVLALATAPEAAMVELPMVTRKRSTLMVSALKSTWMDWSTDSVKGLGGR